MVTIDICRCYMMRLSLEINEKMVETFRNVKRIQDQPLRHDLRTFDK